MKSKIEFTKTDERSYDGTNADRYSADDITMGGQTIDKTIVSGWASLSESMPEENETVWLTELGTNSVSLGCRVYLKNEGWFWAFTNGNFYGEDGKIVTECELTDNDVFTHYHRVPSLPFL